MAKPILKISPGWMTPELRAELIEQGYIPVEMPEGATLTTLEIEGPLLGSTSKIVQALIQAVEKTVNQSFQTTIYGHAFRDLMQRNMGEQEAEL